MGHGMGVGVAETAENGLHLIRLAIAIGIAKEKELRTVADIGAVFVRQDALRNGQSIGPDMKGTAGWFCRIIKDEDFVLTFRFKLVEVLDAFELRVGSLRFLVLHETEKLRPLHSADGIERIHLPGLGPKAAGVIEGKIDGIDHAVFFRGHELDDKVLGNSESGELLGRAPGLDTGGLGFLPRTARLGFCLGGGFVGLGESATFFALFRKEFPLSGNGIDSDVSPAFCILVDKAEIDRLSDELWDLPVFLNEDL